MKFIVECAAPRELSMEYSYDEVTEEAFDYDGESLPCDGGLVPGYWCEGCQYAEEYVDEGWV